jgi:hypothetical protein
MTIAGAIRRRPSGLKPRSFSAPRLLPCLVLGLFVAGALPVLPAAAAGDGEAQGQPSIRLPRTSYDFGAVVPGSRETYLFKILNVGGEPLELLDAGGT